MISYFRDDRALIDLFQPLGLLNRSRYIQSLLLESCDKDIDRDLKASVRIHFSPFEKLLLLRLRISHVSSHLWGMIQAYLKLFFITQMLLRSVWLGP